MLSLAAPLWLLGLALLPVLRWLHRGGRHRAVLPVSHLGLWRGAAAHSPAAGEKQPPDPAWRRRALLAALLLVALAEPRQVPPQQAVTLWLDDSLSMFAREAQGTRLELALVQAAALLAQTPGAEIELRALGDPWVRLATPDAAALQALQARRAAAAATEPTAPPAALLGAQRQHWLLSDGAHPALWHWPAGRRPDRIVQVGSLTRNVGLAQLSARRSPDDPTRLELLVMLSNGGNAAETRELLIATGSTGSTGAERSSHRLAAGASALLTLQVAAADRVRATLQPADALPADDELVLDVTPLHRQRVVVDAGCPAVLRAAVASHPALVTAAADAADAAGAVAALDCGAGIARPDLATLRVSAGAPSRWPPGPALWSAALSGSQRAWLEPGRLPLAATLQAQPGDQVLLAVGGEPAIVGRAGARPLIETSVDFAALAAERGAQTPLLVNLVFERLLGGPLLGRTAAAGRGPAASWVVPAPGGAASAAATAGAGPGVVAPPDATAYPRPLVDQTRWVLLLAVAALLWEVVALARQWLRVGRPAPAGTA